MKKQYVKPSMKVYEMHSRAALLVGSGEPYGYPIGYVPGSIEEDKNQLT